MFLKEESYLVQQISKVNGQTDEMFEDTTRAAFISELRPSHTNLSDNGEHKGIVNCNEEHLGGGGQTQVKNKNNLEENKQEESPED